MNPRHLQPDWQALPPVAAEIVSAILGNDRRVMLFGPPGLGKSSMAKEIARALEEQGRSCWCISADPGSPSFGIPGVLSLGKWESRGWQVEAIEPLCTLDAGRFRLPLVAAVRRLQRLAGEGVMLLDAPGVVRGVAGSELFAGLIDAGQVEKVLVFTGEGRPPPLVAELEAATPEVYLVHGAPEAKRPGKRMRDKVRTAQWDGHLANARTHRLPLSDLCLTGTLPPVEEPSAWVGRQVALLHPGHLPVLGEVIALEQADLIVKAAGDIAAANRLLVRDARRALTGLLETAKPFAAEPLTYFPSALAACKEDTGGPQIAGRMGALDFALVNGLFGDPMLHLRIRPLGRSILFDLGEGSRLSARMAHQVTDVFVSHAHMDHLGGFLWLLRSRLGDFPPCRLYGPPGLARHIECFINSFLWDRIGGQGPAFEVAELHDRYLHRVRLRAGVTGSEPLADVEARDGVLLEEPGFRVRAVELDHHTKVLAFALELAKTVNIRKDRLRKRGWKPGPWLNELKYRLLTENPDVSMTLPDGSETRAGQLGADLAMILPGKKLVYATDLADSEDNRRELVALARNAHTFFCEAAFRESDADKAAKNGHLTTRAAGEIATAAGVSRLVPFHFSRRYSEDPEPLFDELLAACGRVAMPPSMALFAGYETGAGGIIKLDARD